jgi:hypothetical protein
MIKGRTKCHNTCESSSPDSTIKGTLDYNITSTGARNSTGGGMIQIPTPLDAKIGQHLVSISVDDSVVYTSCAVNIVAGNETATQTIPPRIVQHLLVPILRLSLYLHQRLQSSKKLLHHHHNLHHYSKFRAKK